LRFLLPVDGVFGQILRTLVLLARSTFFFEFLKIGNRLSLPFLTGGSASLRLPATYV